MPGRTTNNPSLFDEDMARAPDNQQYANYMVAPNSPGVILVGLSNDPGAIKLQDIPKLLAARINQFPALIQADPDLSVGLCVFDPEAGKWMPLTKDMLHGQQRGR